MGQGRASHRRFRHVCCTRVSCRSCRATSATRTVRSCLLPDHFRAINSTGAMRPLEILSIMFCTFCGVFLPISICRPSGGGPPAAAVLARKSAKNARAKITPVALSEDIEPGLVQRTLVALAIRDGAQVCGRCPGHGKGEVARSCSQHIIDAEDGAPSQHTRNLRCEVLFVLYVHPDVQHVGDIETAFGE